MGAVGGAVVLVVAAGAVRGGATVSTDGADGTNRPIAGIAVTAPVFWPVLALVGGVGGGLIAGVTRWRGMW